MAIHNYVRMVGYVLRKPVIINEGEIGAEKVILSIRTLHRSMEGYIGPKYQDINIFYDDDVMIEKFKKLDAYDIIDIKGVINILTVNRITTCDACHLDNVKYGCAASFVYPVDMHKLNGVKRAYENNQIEPDRLLSNQYKEISNQAFIVGTVVSEPKMIGSIKYPLCKYQLGIDRKYYIKTQGHLTSDYPVVCTYGKQARMDIMHLKVGSVIMADGFVQNRKVLKTMVCQHCGNEYSFPDTLTEIVPYSVEYMNNFVTDEELAEMGILNREEESST